MAAESLRVMLTGGGTGGHLFPALAIADELRALEPASRCLFVGTRDRIEARVVPQRGYPFTSIWISGIQRRRIVANLLLPLKIVVSLAQSFFLIRHFRPHAVIGTGGYVCGPLLLVASLLRIPVFLHESNSDPGLTTKLLASRVTTLFTAFDVTAGRLPAGTPVMRVGTPVRRDLFGGIDAPRARAGFGLEPRTGTLLVLGGSLGAASVNAAVLHAVDRLLALQLQLIWQTGADHADRMRSALGHKPSVRVEAFIEDMGAAYAAADLVLCRAGATTIAELTALGKPSILVPYPFAAGDHQTVNARALEAAGAAVVVPDGELADRLADTVREVIRDPSRLAAMSSAARRLGFPEAGTRIARELLRYQP